MLDHNSEAVGRYLQIILQEFHVLDYLISMKLKKMLQQKEARKIKEKLIG